MTERRQETILVVDDSELACESVKTALGSAGYTVVALTSPFGLIKAIRENSPTLVLLDVGLGSVNGTKLVSLARQHVTNGCRILLYSSREDALLRGDASSSGADGYIHKSTTGQDLVAAVRQWLNGARGSQK